MKSFIIALPRCPLSSIRILVYNNLLQIYTFLIRNNSRVLPYGQISNQIVKMVIAKSLNSVCGLLISHIFSKVLKLVT